MDIKKLRGFNKKELEDEKNKLSEEIVNLKKEQWQGKLKDNNAMRKKRRNLAQLLTVVKEKEVLEGITGGKEVISSTKIKDKRARRKDTD